MVRKSLYSLFRRNSGAGDVLNLDTSLSSSIHTLYHVSTSQIPNRSSKPRLGLDDITCQKDDLGLGILKSSSAYESEEKPSKNSAAFHHLRELMLSKTTEKGIQTSPPHSDGDSDRNENANTNVNGWSSMELTESQKALEQQMQLLSDKIQRKVIYTMQTLDYPIASKAVDKLIEQEPVGFSVALSFIINTATRSISKDVSTGSFHLSQENINVLRQKFYKLTSAIEYLRRTRVKLCTRFDKQIKDELDLIVASNSTGGLTEFDMDGNEVSLSLGLENENYTTHSNLFSIPTTTTRIKFTTTQDGETHGHGHAEDHDHYHLNEKPDGNSFEGLFWGNYCSILKSLDENCSKVFDTKPDQKSQSQSQSFSPILSHGEMEIRWEAWDKDEIFCRISPDKILSLSNLAKPMYLNILTGMIDLVTDNFTKAESLLQESLQECKESKSIIKSMSKNIKRSKLNTTETKEVLKIIRVAVATSVTILKCIEKTTRISRFFISEGIQNLMMALNLKRNLGKNKNSQMNLKMKQFIYKPNYFILSFTMKCGPGILIVLDKLETSSHYLKNKDSIVSRTENLNSIIINKDVCSNEQQPLEDPNGQQSQLEKEPISRQIILQQNEQYQKQDQSKQELKIDVEAIMPQLQSQSNTGVDITMATTTKGFGSESQVQLPSEIESRSLNLKPKILLPLGSSIIDEFKTDFFDEFEKINAMISDRIQIAYDILCLPNTSVWEEDGNIPFILGMCSIIAKTLIETQPYRDVPARYKALIKSSLKQLNHSTNFGKEKKDFVRDIARELTLVDEYLDNFTTLLLIKPHTSIQNKNKNSNNKSITYNSNVTNASNTNASLYSSNSNANKSLIEPGSSLSSGQSLLISQIMIDQTQKEGETTNTVSTPPSMWQIQWASSADGILVKHVPTTRQTNYANINLRTKCLILGSLLKFAGDVCSFTGLNVKAAELNVKGVNQSLKKIQKKLEHFMKKNKNRLTVEEKLYFGQIFSNLTQTHVHAVTLLGKLNACMSQVASILFVVNEYLRAEDSLYDSLLYETMGRFKAGSHDIMEYKIEQAGVYVNNLFILPISVQIPIKLNWNQVCL